MKHNKKKRFCYQCEYSHYMDTASPHFQNSFLKGERIALLCIRNRVTLHIHTHCPPDCSFRQQTDDDIEDIEETSETPKCPILGP